MLLTGKLAGAAQLGIGRHRRRAVPMARLTAEVHLPGAGLGQEWTTTQPERSGRTAGAADRTGRREEPARPIDSERD